MISVYVKESKANKPNDMIEWLSTTLGEPGARYYYETGILLGANEGGPSYGYEMHFGVTFETEEDAVQFKLRWL